MKERIEWLDGVRGMAALSVVLFHLLNLLEVSWIHDLLVYSNYSILNMFWNGPAAVTLFFVLSGYVLTLGMMRKGDGVTSRWLAGYCIGRISRIAFPFWGACILSLCFLKLWYDPQAVQAVWLSDMWKANLQLDKQLLQQLLLILPRTEHVLIPQAWTLTVELQISLLLPLIFLGVSKRLATAVLVTLFVGVLLHQTFVVHFLLGMLLAIYDERIMSWVRRLSRLRKLLLFLFGLILLTYAWTPTSKVSEVLFWVINSIGAIIFIAVGSNLNTVKFFFQSKPLVFLGMISYSLYLTHNLVYLVLSYSKISSPIVLIFTFLFVAFFVATIFYYIVERPSVKMGKYLKQRSITFKRGKRHVVS